MAKSSRRSEKRPYSSRSNSVIFSMTCVYALRALCRLAAMNQAGFVSLREICEGSELPEHFVAKIFQDLTHAGLLDSAKGRGGGFALMQPADQISLYHIVEAIDGPQLYTGCVVGLSNCDDKQPCPQHDCVKPVRQQIINYLKATTLDQVCTEQSDEPCSNDQASTKAT